MKKYDFDKLKKLSFSCPGWLISYFQVKTIDFISTFECSRLICIFFIRENCDRKLTVFGIELLILYHFFTLVKNSLCWCLCTLKTKHNTKFQENTINILATVNKIIILQQQYLLIFYHFTALRLNLDILRTVNNYITGLLRMENFIFPLHDSVNQYTRLLMVKQQLSNRFRLCKMEQTCHHILEHVQLGIDA